MDTEDPRYPESGKREGRFLPRRGAGRGISGPRPAHRRGGTRDWEPHLLPSESRALLAGAYSGGAERDAVVARNNYRSLDDVVPAALRRRHQPVENYRAGAAAARARSR